MNDSFQQAVDNAQAKEIIALRQEIEYLISRVSILNIIISGNGNPSSGLTQQVALLRVSIDTLRESFDDDRKQRATDVRGVLMPIIQIILAVCRRAV